MKFISAIAYGLVILSSSLFAGESPSYSIDDQFPGGNVKIAAQDKNVVLFSADSRGPFKGECDNRYWCFRVKNAQGQKLRFQLLEHANSNIFGHVTARGPLVSRDGGLTWNWLSPGKPQNLPNSFEYSFGPNEKEVYFAPFYPYSSPNLKRFIDSLDQSKGNFRAETLCRSEEGKDVLSLRFGNANSPKKIGILITSRHHANETVSSYLIEGLIREALSGSEDGNYILSNADFFVVPMVDWDGVEKGGQRQTRKEHDYNRDYAEAKFASVQAIQKQTLEWAKDKHVIAIDFHANTLDIRGKRIRDPKEWAHNMLFLIYSKESRAYGQRISSLLREFTQGHSILYDGSSDSISNDVNPAMSKGWFQQNLHPLFAATAEVPSCPASGMPHSENEFREFGSLYLKALVQFIKDLPEKPFVGTDTMQTPPVLRPVPRYLQDAERKFQSAPSLTVTPGGRLWVAWHTGSFGSEGEENCHVAASSGDGGKTWTPPLFAVDVPGPLRTLDPGFWTDPNGKVWLFFAFLYGQWDGRGGLWVMSPDDPENPNSEWSAPRRICHGFLKNKPLVTRDGRWLFPVEFMAAKPHNYSRGKMVPMEKLPPDAVFSFPEYNDADVFESLDRGKTVHFLGKAHVPPKDRSCYEHMIVERKDGSLWMLGRTKYGIGESFSKDGGKTWSEMVPSKIPHPDSRFFIGRLKSGRLLLIKNGPMDRRTKREQMMAFLSEDDGKTWKGGLMLDERRGVSYPDAVQDHNGVIYAVHDRNRTTDHEILIHRFTEEDILAKKPVSQVCRLKTIVNQAGITP
ncbi:MAG: exo-alpha-sialidase [Planctomycetia bacterium]|nr:exo-alpha-sialidase [Planctomycetia bacterium]